MQATPNPPSSITDHASEHPPIPPADLHTDAALERTQALPEEGALPMSPLFCTACGAKNVADANYCKQCGHRLEKTGPLRITEEAFALAATRDEQVRELLVLAYRRYEDGDLAGAVETCGRALGAAPNSTDAHSLMSTLYEKQGEREKAIAERERVLELNPGSIADREKLEELREGTLTLTRRKIISAHRASRGLFETRAGAAAVAIGAALFVLVAGALAIVLGRPKKVEALAQRPASAQAAGPYGGLYANASPNGWGAFPGYAGPQAYAQYPQNVQNAQATPRAAQPEQSAARSHSSARADEYPDGPPVSHQVPPMRIVPRVPDISDGFGRSGAGQPDQNGVVHLPDNGLAPSEIGPPPTGANTPATISASGQTPGQIQSQTPAPRHNQGKIEIIVAPDTTRAGSVNTPSRRADTGDAGTPTMDARSQRRVALDLQMRSQYRQAATAYIKALDGAGDDAAEIHQQIGLCYQRMDDHDSAVAQYNAAIDAYKSLIAAGKNVEAAKRGIRTCEAGIKACQ